MGVWTVNGKRFDRGTPAGLTALWELAKVKATLEYGGFGFGLELPAAEMLPGDRSLRCSVILAGRPLVGDSGGGELPSPSTASSTARTPRDFRSRPG